MLRALTRFRRPTQLKANFTCHRNARTSESISDPSSSQTPDISAISSYSSTSPGAASHTESGSPGDTSKSLVRASVSSTINKEPRSHSNPPFNTHAFVCDLEKAFPTPTATSLMRATRALLIDRIGKVRRAGLTNQDAENQAYLFRAALSELRSELTTSIRNNSSALSTGTNTMRKEVERLGVKMKEDIDTMKHEIQMELETRKNEAKSDLKLQDIAIEELLNKAIVNVSDLRTDVEEVKWESMRRAVMLLFGFVMVIIVSMELRPKPSSDHPPRPPPPPPHPEPELERTGI